MKNKNGFPGLLERFFTQRLIAQRRVSPHTVAAYRDTFRLLLQFVEKRTECSFCWPSTSPPRDRNVLHLKRNE